LIAFSITPFLHSPYLLGCTFSLSIRTRGFERIAAGEGGTFFQITRVLQLHAAFCMDLAAAAAVALAFAGSFPAPVSNSSHIIYCLLLWPYIFAQI
jgi:hypothetical protein